MSESVYVTHIINVSAFVQTDLYSWFTKRPGSNASSAVEFGVPCE